MKKLLTDLKYMFNDDLICWILLLTSLICYFLNNPNKFLHIFILCLSILIVKYCSKYISHQKYKKLRAEKYYNETFKWLHPDEQEIFLKLLKYGNYEKLITSSLSDKYNELVGIEGSQYLNDYSGNAKVITFTNTHSKQIFKMDSSYRNKYKDLVKMLNKMR